MSIAAECSIAKMPVTIAPKINRSFEAVCTTCYQHFARSALRFMHEVMTHIHVQRKFQLQEGGLESDSSTIVQCHCELLPMDYVLSWDNELHPCYITPVLVK